MSSALLRRAPVRALAATLALIASGTPTVLASTTSTSTALASAAPSHASLPPQNSHGFDPYYRDQAPIASRQPASPAHDPSGLSIAISIVVTLSVLAAIAAHVRWTRIRGHQANRAAA